MNYFIQKIYFLILRLLKPLTISLGKIYSKHYSKEHIFKHYYEIENCLKPGDVLLTKSDEHLSNLINVGYWKHALVFVGGEKPQIVEAVGQGVIKRSLIEMLGNKDRIIILRPTSELIENEEQMKTYISFVEKQIGKNYDRLFDSFTQSEENAFYCSELVYSGIKHGNPKSQFNLRDHVGIMTVKPMDLFNMISKEKFEKILEIKH